MDEPPRIDFPCYYPIKVIVELAPDIIDQISEIVKIYDDKISLDDVTQNPSRNGKFVSIRFRFWATGEPQLRRLFDDLKTNKAVRMVL